MKEQIEVLIALPFNLLHFNFGYEIHFIIFKLIFNINGVFIFNYEIKSNKLKKKKKKLL